MNKNNSKLVWKNYNGKKKLFTVIPKSENSTVQHRDWDPLSSKLGAALFNGLEIFPFEFNSKIFYLQQVPDSTLDHLLDIIHPDGTIYVQGINNDKIKNSKNVIIDEEKNKLSSKGNSKKLFDVIYLDKTPDEDLQTHLTNCESSLKNSGFLIITLNKIGKTNYTSFQDQINKIIINSNLSLTLIQEINLSNFFKNNMMIVMQKI